MYVCTGTSCLCNTMGSFPSLYDASREGVSGLGEKRIVQVWRMASGYEAGLFGYVLHRRLTALSATKYVMRLRTESRKTRWRIGFCLFQNLKTPLDDSIPLGWRGLRGDTRLSKHRTGHGVAPGRPKSCVMILTV